MYKLRLTEFVFKFLKRYTFKEFNDLFLQRNSGRRRNENMIAVIDYLIKTVLMTEIILK